MHDQSNPYSVVGEPGSALLASENERVGFIRKTYGHLFGAITALIGIEVVLFNTVPADTMDSLVTTMIGGYGWLIVLGAFMLVGMVARSWANSDASKPMQYVGLSLYVVAEAVILLPLLYIAIRFVGPSLPIKAAVVTGICFVCLTGFVMYTRADLIGWGKYLAMAGFAALAMIVAGILFGFDLGLFFSGAMVALMCGYIMYDTSNVLHHYRTDQYVAASLALFASLTTLFWYILRIMIALSGRD